MTSPHESTATRSHGPAGSLPRGLLILIGMGAAVLTVGGLKEIGSLLGPAFLALVLMITVHPVRDRLVRLHLPGWLATLVTILVVYAVLVAMVVALVVSVGRLAALVPTYSGQINDLVDKVGDLLRERGVRQTQVNAVVKTLDFGKIFGYATTLLQGLLGVLSNAFFIAVLVLFMGFDAAKLPRHLRDAGGQRPAVVTALASFAHGTRRYFAVSAGFGLIVAVIDWGALLVIGIPAAGVWAVLSFVTNFIPNIGFVVGVVPPAVLGLLEGGVGEMVVVIAVYVVINFVIQTVIQPKIVGDSLGLSATLTFLSLVFWSWVLGPLGALLAIPMTLLFKALLVDVDPQARWLVPLLSGRSDSSATSPADTEAKHPEPSP